MVNTDVFHLIPSPLLGIRQIRAYFNTSLLAACIIAFVRLSQLSFDVNHICNFGQSLDQVAGET